MILKVRESKELKSSLKSFDKIPRPTLNTALSRLRKEEEFT
jgi:hypothetical protein